MDAENWKHWGKWIIARWAFLGFKRIADLQAAVGCSYAAIYQWKNSENPPQAMQKGFDRMLIRALRTDRWTLFCAYASIGPEKAPVIEPPRDRPQGWDEIKVAPVAAAAVA
jgi:hypothetical protein